MLQQSVLVNGVNPGMFYNGAFPVPYVMPYNVQNPYMPPPVAVQLIPMYFNQFNPCMDPSVMQPQFSVVVTGPPQQCQSEFSASPFQSFSSCESVDSELPAPALSVDHSRSVESSALPMPLAEDRSRSASPVSLASVSACSSSLSSCGSKADPRRERTKQYLIPDVCEKLDAILSRVFKHKKEGQDTVVYAHDSMDELDVKRDVLRGNHVGNVRAKNVQSLNVLAQFVEMVLAPDNPHVLRVDVIHQRKNGGVLKGLLVNIQFRNQQDFVYVGKTIFYGQGFDQKALKFAPAQFAKDCAWKGRPKNLRVKSTPEGLRVCGPLPRKLRELGLEENCRIKSMSVSWKANKTRKRKTFEVPAGQFHQVLYEGKFRDGRHVERPINSRKTLTISFEMDWKTAFWRSASAAPVNSVHV